MYNSASICLDGSPIFQCLNGRGRAPPRWVSRTPFSMLARMGRDSNLGIINILSIWFTRSYCFLSSCNVCTLTIRFINLIRLGGDTYLCILDRTEINAQTRCLPLFTIPSKHSYCHPPTSNTLLEYVFHLYLNTSQYDHLVGLN